MIKKVLLAFAVMFLSSLSPALSPAPAPSPTPPFWKAKTEIYEKMKDKRYIAVSAKGEDEGGEKKLSVVAAGIIHAPASFTHKIVMKFGEYRQYVPYIEESSFDEATQNVFIHGAVLGYHVKMTLHIDDQTTAEGHHLQWNSIGGSFIGMKGSIDEKSLDAEHTEISMNGLYKGESLGIPAFLLDWGLEFAAQRAAGSMRSHIESEWENSKKH